MATFDDDLKKRLERLANLKTPKRREAPKTAPVEEKKPKTFESVTPVKTGTAQQKTVVKKPAEEVEVKEPPKQIVADGITPTTVVEKPITKTPTAVEPVAAQAAAEPVSAGPKLPEGYKNTFAVNPRERALYERYDEQKGYREQAAELGVPVKSAGERGAELRGASYLYKEDGTGKSGQEASNADWMAYLASIKDPKKQAELTSAFYKDVSTPGSKRYDPYYTTGSNNKEARELFGRDSFDQSFFDANRNLYANLKLNASGNPTAGKKGTAQYAAYKMWHMETIDEPFTQSAEEELAALRSTISQQASYGGTASEIYDALINSEDFKSEYPSLYKLRKAKDTYTYELLNRPVRVGDESIKSMISAALRGEDISEDRDYLEEEAGYKLQKYETQIGRGQIEQARERKAVRDVRTGRLVAGDIPGTVQVRSSIAPSEFSDLTAQYEKNGISTPKGNVQFSRGNASTNYDERPKIQVSNENADIVRSWGMEANIGDTMTVASQGFTSQDGKNTFVVTPIRSDGTMLNQVELEQYVDKILSSDDPLKADTDRLILGIFTGDEEAAISASNEWADKLHESHESRLGAIAPPSVGSNMERIVNAAGQKFLTDSAQAARDIQSFFGIESPQKKVTDAGIGMLRSLPYDNLFDLSVEFGLATQADADLVKSERSAALSAARAGADAAALLAGAPEGEFKPVSVAGEARKGAYNEPELQAFYDNVQSERAALTQAYGIDDMNVLTSSIRDKIIEFTQKEIELTEQREVLDQVIARDFEMMGQTTPERQAEYDALTQQIEQVQADGRQAQADYDRTNALSTAAKEVQEGLNVFKPKSRLTLALEAERAKVYNPFLASIGFDKSPASKRLFAVDTYRLQFSDDEWADLLEQDLPFEEFDKAVQAQTQKNLELGGTSYLRYIRMSPEEKAAAKAEEDAKFADTMDSFERLRVLASDPGFITYAQARDKQSESMTASQEFASYWDPSMLDPETAAILSTPVPIEYQDSYQEWVAMDRPSAEQFDALSDLYVQYKAIEDSDPGLGNWVMDLATGGTWSSSKYNPGVGFGYTAAAAVGVGSNEFLRLFPLIGSLSAQGAGNFNDIFSGNVDSYKNSSLYLACESALADIDRQNRGWRQYMADTGRPVENIAFVAGSEATRMLSNQIMGQGIATVSGVVDAMGSLQSLQNLNKLTRAYGVLAALPQSIEIGASEAHNKIESGGDFVQSLAYGTLKSLVELVTECDVTEQFLGRVFGRGVTSDMILSGGDKAAANLGEAAINWIVDSAVSMNQEGMQEVLSEIGGLAADIAIYGETEGTTPEQLVQAYWGGFSTSLLLQAFTLPQTAKSYQYAKQFSDQGIQMQAEDWLGMYQAFQEDMLDPELARVIRESGDIGEIIERDAQIEIEMQSPEITSKIHTPEVREAEKALRMTDNRIEEITAKQEKASANIAEKQTTIADSINKVLQGISPAIDTVPTIERVQKELVTLRDAYQAAESEKAQLEVTREQQQAEYQSRQETSRASIRASVVAAIDQEIEAAKTSVSKIKELTSALAEASAASEMVGIEKFADSKVQEAADFRMVEIAGSLNEEIQKLDTSRFSDWIRRKTDAHKALAMFEAGQSEADIFRGMAEEADIFGKAEEEAPRAELETLEPDDTTTQPLLEQGHEAISGIDPAVLTDKIGSVAQDLLRQFKSKLPLQELTTTLSSLYTDALGVVDWNTATELANNIGRDIVEGSTVTDRTLTDEYADLRDQLRTTPITLTSTQMAEVASQFYSYTNFRKSNFNRLNLKRSDGISLDSLWQELSGQYPELFDSTTREGDQPSALVEVINTLKPATVSRFAEGIDEAARAAGAAVVNSFLGLSETKETGYPTVTINDAGYVAVPRGAMATPAELQAITLKPSTMEDKAKLSSTAMLESVVGYKPDTKTFGGRVKRASTITNTLYNDLKIPRTTRYQSKDMRTQQHRGEYYRHPGVVVTRASQDIDAAAHELGHAIFQKTGVFKGNTPSAEYASAFEAMRRNLPEQFVKAYTDAGDEAQLYDEAGAEFMRKFLTNRNAAVEFAGEDFVNRFENNILTQNDKKALDRARSEYINLLSAEAIEQNKAMIASGKDKPQNKKPWSKLITGFADTYYTFLDFDDSARKAGYANESPEKRMYITMSNLAHTTSRANNIISGQLVAPDGRVISGSLEDVVSAIRFRDKDDFNLYSLLKHDLDRKAHDKPVFGSQTAEQSAINLLRLEKQHPDFVETHRKLMAWWNAFMEEWIVKPNAIPDARETINKFREMYPNYVPTFRSFTDESDVFNETIMSKGGALGQAMPSFKKATGSDKAVKSPIENMVNRIKSIVPATEKVLAMRQMHEIYQETPGLGEYIFEVESPGENVRNTDLLRILDKDGNEHYYKVLDPVMHNVLLSSPKEVDLIFRMIGKLTNVFKRGTTSNNIFFGISNTMRDFVESYTKGTSITPVEHALDFAKAFGDVLASNLPGEFGEKFTTEQLQSYMAAGGGDTSVAPNSEKGVAAMERAMYSKYFQDSFVKIFSKNLNVRERASALFGLVDASKSKLSDYVLMLNNAVETAQRLAEFKRQIGYGTINVAKRALGAEVKAAIPRVAFSGSQEATTDFSRRGNAGSMRTLSTVFAFMNPPIQGTYKLYRMAREAKYDKGKIVSYVTKSAVMYTLAKVLLNMLIDDDEEDKLAYEELAPNVKRDNFLFPKRVFGGKKGEFYRWATPPGIIAALGDAGAQAIVNAMKQEGSWEEFVQYELQDFVTENVSEIASSMNPYGSPIFGSVVEIMRNRTWYDSPIIPQWMLDKSLSKELQIKDSTSSVAIWLAQNVPGLKGNISPIQVDYFINQAFGITGDLAIGDIGDAVMSALEGDGSWLQVAEATGSTAQDLFMRRITTDPTVASDITNNMYDMSDYMTGIVADLKEGGYSPKLNKSLTPAEVKEAGKAAELMNKKDGVLYKAKKNTSGYYDEIRGIESGSLDAVEKDLHIRDIKKRMLFENAIAVKYAEEFLKKYVKGTPEMYKRLKSIP